MSIIELKAYSFDTKEFEKGNDLTNDNFCHMTTQSGTFIVQDGTEWGYTFDTHLSLFKTS